MRSNHRHSERHSLPPSNQFASSHSRAAAESGDSRTKQAYFRHKQRRGLDCSTTMSPEGVPVNIEAAGPEFVVRPPCPHRPLRFPPGCSAWLPPERLSSLSRAFRVYLPCLWSCSQLDEVEGPSPRIYIYELPTRFTTWQLGVAGPYQDFGRVEGFALVEAMLRSRHRTVRRGSASPTRSRACPVQTWCGRADPARGGIACPSARRWTRRKRTSFSSQSPAAHSCAPVSCLRLGRRSFEPAPAGRR